MVKIDSRSSGFTLIEMLLVVVLISLLAGLSFPQLKNVYQRIQFDAAVRTFLSLYDYGRTYAFTHHTFVRLARYDNGSIALECRAAAADREEPAYAPVAGRFGKARALPEDVSCSFRDGDAVYFNPDGSVNAYRLEIVWDDHRTVTIEGEGYFGVPRLNERSLA